MKDMNTADLSVVLSGEMVDSFQAELDNDSDFQAYLDAREAEALDFQMANEEAL